MADQSLEKSTAPQGGVQTFTVEFASGVTEALVLKPISMRHAGRYFELFSEISAFVELVCDKPTGWADTLTVDSLFALDEALRKFNDDRIDRFLRRQLAATLEMKGKAEQVGMMKS